MEKKVVENIYYQPDERVERYLYHLVKVDNFWHVAKVVFVEEDFSGRILNQKEYFVVPTIVDDVEELDKSLKGRVWIDKQDLRWLAKLADEGDNEPLSVLSE